MSLAYCLVPLFVYLLIYIICEVIERIFYRKVKYKMHIYIAMAIICALCLIAITAIYLLK